MADVFDHSYYEKGCIYSRVLRARYYLIPFCHDLEPRTEGNHRIRAESQKKKEKNEKNKKNREDRAVRTVTNSVTCRSHYTGLLLKRVP